jgi:amidase
MTHKIIFSTILLCLTTLVVSSEEKIFDLGTANVLEIQEAFDQGILTSEKLVEMYLARIEAYDQSGPALNTIIYLNPNALEEARKLDAERKESGPRSPLHGIPILVKDNYDTYDMPTTGGSIALKDSVPLNDAFTIRKLREAGAILLAKTNLDEFARGATGTSSLGGQTLNPYVLDRIPGGSSGGSSVGVAALFGQIGLGTETGSSIRNPATKANLVGFSPSEGLVSRHGIIPISLTYDRAGPMTRNVTDAAIAMAVMAGADAGDLTSLRGLHHSPENFYLESLRPGGLAGARIGVLRQLFGDGPEDVEATALVDAAIEEMKKAGAFIIDPVMTNLDLWELLADTNVGTGEYKQAINFYLSTRGENVPVKSLDELIASGGFLGRLRQRYEESNDVPLMSQNPDYLGRARGREIAKSLVLELLDKYDLDALVYPHETKPVRSIAEAVPGGGDDPAPPWPRQRGTGNRISTVTGFPTLTIPVGFHSYGMPIGIEFLGRPFDEAKLIRLTYSFEAITDHRRLPKVTPHLESDFILKSGND